MKKKQIVLLGAGGHARVVWDALNLQGDLQRSADTDVRVVAVLDDNADLWGHLFMGIEVQGPLQIIDHIKVDAAVIAIGDNRARHRAYEIVKACATPLWSVIHPRAVLAGEIQLGEGIVILANAVVNVGSRIGDNVILDAASTVDHDCSIGMHAHIALGAHLAGSVSVGEGTLIGIGSAVIPKVTIGRWATIGAGSVVTENVPDEASFVMGGATFSDRKG